MGGATLGSDGADMTELRSALDNAVLGELRESVGDDPEFLAELVDEFLQDAPIQLESLRVAATSGDATAARRAAHTLKGNSRTFGAGELASLCQAAETAAVAGDLDAVLSGLDEIDREWRRVGAELLAWRDGLA
jgi:HPt (histidine-containing phosphotransfer) domain-containing protein